MDFFFCVCVCACVCALVDLWEVMLGCVYLPHVDGYVCVCVLGSMGRVSTLRSVGVLTEAYVQPM